MDGAASPTSTTDGGGLHHTASFGSSTSYVRRERASKQAQGLHKFSTEGT